MTNLIHWLDLFVPLLLLFTREIESFTSIWCGTTLEKFGQRRTPRRSWSVPLRISVAASAGASSWVPSIDDGWHPVSPLPSDNEESLSANVVYYNGEGEWDEEFVQRRQAMVPWVQLVESMPESLPQHLLESSKLYLLRHGQSTANVDGIISSDRWTLAYSNLHGLTDLGYSQAQEAATALWNLLQQPEPTEQQKHKQHRIVFVSSPLARARQTAKACLDRLREILDEHRDNTSASGSSNNAHVEWHVDDAIRMSDALVERFFGRLDGTALESYAYVWPLDRFNVTHTTFDVESVAAVCTRLHEYLVNDLLLATESKHDNQADQELSAADATLPASTMTHYVLVSHADVLQIAQLYAAQVDNVGEFSSFRFQSTCCAAWYMNACAGKW
jgi:broad specificity phosphatase PhoE